jgi:FkbM family methyltransferase
MVSPHAIRSRFGHRLRTLEARRRPVSGLDREARLIEASEAYRQQLASDVTSPDPSRHRMTLDGLHWWVPVRDPSRGIKAKWVQKQRLPYHGIALTRELAIGGVMIDLGAHIGRTSIPRVVLGDVTAAYCAEPDPISYACLAASVIANGLRGAVLPDQTAIGDVDGAVNLVRLGQSAGFYVAATPPPGADVVQVPCTTLDSWVERLGIDLDAVTFVKVDVEGFEQRLVRGASRVLGLRHIAWQFEVNPVRLRAAGDEPDHLYASFRGAFTHFIDMNRSAGGARVRPIAQIEDALRYVDPAGKTDVLLYSA